MNRVWRSFTGPASAGRPGRRDVDEGGRLLFDEPVVIQCYTSRDTILGQKDGFRSFLIRLGSEAKQAAVGFVIDRDYMEIEFDLDGKPIS